MSVFGETTYYRCTNRCMPYSCRCFLSWRLVIPLFVLDTPEVRYLHTNFKEVLAVILAAKRWGKLWSNKHVIIQSDNTTAVSIINKGTTGNPIIMRYLGELFWLSAVYNFRITATYLPGCMNFIADAISRMHEPYCLCKTLGFLLAFIMAVTHCCLVVHFFII